jgi:hypothetical protein
MVANDTKLRRVRHSAKWDGNNYLVNIRPLYLQPAPCHAFGKNIYQNKMHAPHIPEGKLHW